MAPSHPLTSSALLDLVFDHAPVGLAFWDTELRYERVNDHLARINGSSPEAHLGRTLTEVLGPFGEELSQRLRNVMETGEAIVDLEIQGEVPSTPGQIRHWLASYYPVVDADGATLGVGAVVAETTRQTEAQEREREARAEAEALVRAGAALAESVQPEAVLAALATAAVPRLADWCAIHVTRNDVPSLAAVAHSDPEREALAWELNERYPPVDSGAPGVASVIRTGERVVFESIPAGMLEASAQDAGHLRIMRELDLRSGAILPLTARGRTLGALTLIAAESGRSYTPERLVAAEALAAQAAVALDNATLYAEQASVADALQRSLLPDRLPSVPGVEIAARYRPAGRVNAVGGDFYDVWPDGRGTWRAVVGDVAGKGASAAALTALVRHTLHAGALHGDGIARELTLANDALHAQTGSGMFCTAVYACLHSTGDVVRLELVCAGHPPPLLRRASGTVEEVPVAGALLGLEAGTTYAEAVAELAPGDVLLFYTDGASELRDRSALAGERALREVLARAGSGSASELVEAVEQHVLVESGGTPRDDLAVLALRNPGA